MKMDDSAVRKMTLQEFRTCQQEQCAYNILGKGCRACDDCNAGPYDIRKGCDRCFACENVPDTLRWGDNIPGLQEKLLIARAMREAQEKIDPVVIVEEQKPLEIIR